MLSVIIADPDPNYPKIQSIVFLHQVRRISKVRENSSTTFSVRYKRPTNRRRRVQL